MQIKKIIKDYTPNSKTLLTPESQAKAIQELYDQIREFFAYFNSAEFIQTVKGEKGDPGAEGARGEKGLKGDKGEQGVVGPIGPRGPKGDTGANGIPGPKGDKGDTGARGEIGPIGPRGPQGLDGIPGRKGDKGDQGSTGVPFGILGVFNTYQELVTEAQREDAKFYLVASLNDQNGDLYVYRAKYDDFIFLNNVIYDLAFQIISGPPGRNYLTFTKGEHIDEYGNIQIDKTETMDEYGYLHTNVVLNYLKGNGVKKTEWTQDDRDSQWSKLVITFDNDTTATIKVKNGKGIDKTEKTGTNVLVDSYRITYSDGTYFDYIVTNGKGINRIEKTSTDVLTDTYTIYWNDNTTTTYLVTNGRGIVKIEKTATAADNITDTYTITYNDNTTSTFTVVNGNGITKVEKTETNVLVDTYTITFTTGVTTTFQVTNGRGIAKVEKTNTNALVDTYTITYNDNTTSTFTVTNGKGIVKIELTNTTLLVDTYTITWNDNTTSTYTVTNGRGITSINKTGRDSQTLEDIYTITYNDNTTFVFRIKSTTPYEEAVEAGYDKSIKTFYGIINGNIWIGPGQNYADVYDNDDYKYENINVNNPLNIECIQDYIYVIYPADSEFMFNLTMSGFPVPMEPVDTTTIQDYYILKSVNQYDGNFNITI